MYEYAIQTKNLEKKYKNKKAVDNLNLNIEKGKIYGLLGKNGAGKTTTMCMLLNLAKPNSGEIFILGEKNYSKIGSLLETPGFYENLNGFDNLKIFSKIKGDYDKNKILKSLKLVGLEKDKKKKFKNYSLGMKQRLGIALAIMDNPEILILDEPINGLDPLGIIEIRNLLKKLRDENNTTIIISSHILNEIESIADTIAIINEGKLIEELTKEELEVKKNKYVEFEVSNLDLAIEILKKIGFIEDIDFKTNKNGFKLIKNLDSRSKINEIFVKSKIEVQKMNLNEDSLEEYFKKMI